MHVHPTTIYAVNGHGVREPQYQIDGMTVHQLFVAHMLGGLMAHYPAVMLDPETHINNVIKLAHMAFEKA